MKYKKNIVVQKSWKNLKKEVQNNMVSILTHYLTTDEMCIILISILGQNEVSRVS